MSKDGKRLANGARRQFMHAAKGVGVLGAIAVLFGRARPELPAASHVAPDEPKGDGYRETEHIRKYYRTARYW